LSCRACFLQHQSQRELFIPTYSRTEPRIYFGLVDTPSDELAISDRLVRFKMRAAGEHKIGVRAAVTTGRIGYMYPTGNKHALIVRNFFVNRRASTPMCPGPNLKIGAIPPKLVV
jgi:hypothetical protein